MRQLTESFMTSKFDEYLKFLLDSQHENAICQKLKGNKNRKKKKKGDRNLQHMRIFVSFFRCYM